MNAENMKEAIERAKKSPLIKAAWQKTKAGLVAMIRETGTREAVEMMMCAGVMGMVGMVWQMRVDLAAIRAEVDAHPAKEVGAKVDDLAKRLLTRDDVALVVSADQWRRKIESELMEVKARVMFRAWENEARGQTFPEVQIDADGSFPGGAIDRNPPEGSHETR